ncbi:YrzK family protein [Bacillus pumilus]|nr:YrzK family protein [Bacillus pumilus]
MRLRRKLGGVEYNGDGDMDGWEQEEMDQPGFVEESGSE